MKPFKLSSVQSFLKLNMFFKPHLIVIIIILASLPLYKYYLKSVTILAPSSCSDVYNNITCANGGILKMYGQNLVCKCQKNYYGEDCGNEVWTSIFMKILGFDETNTNLAVKITQWWWFVVPFTYKSRFMSFHKFHVNEVNRYFFGDNEHDQENSTKTITNSRILPPARPLHCLMDEKLPPFFTLYNKVFQRKPNGFKPDPRRRNLFFHAFFQYFMLQFFNTDLNSMVTASQLYGTDHVTKRELRSFSNGKLKTEYLNGEHYPPYLSSAKRVKMVYPPMKQISDDHWFNKIMTKSSSYKTQKPKWAMGHPLLSMNPLLFVMSTLWIREHNRVCDVLAKTWPSWTDEQTFNIARRIVIGEMLKIMFNDIMNVYTGHSLPFRYEPEILDEQLVHQYDQEWNTNTSTYFTPQELLLVSMWPSSLPDAMNDTSLESMLFSNNRQLLMDGMSGIIKFMVNQEMGMVTHNNDGPATEPLTKLMLKLSRENSFQSFNNYRRHLGLRPYKNFFVLTKDRTTANELKSLYNNVENVELIPGILTEKRKYGVLPVTGMAMTYSWIIKTILTNPLSNQRAWKPETFGGDVGFDIIKFADIETLVCNNMENEFCKHFKIKLYVK